ncbi:MAG: hydantoinase/oxoprolinase family protein, partial [Dehalococcoidia bacterium]|nr:hydantoinase/oxoprolinase family protein [Dehalococcoidia bacterium]
MKYKIGVDVGGTFTDFLLVDEKGDAEIYKTLSTPKDLTIGFFNGMKEMADARSQSLADFLKQVEIIVHGTTVTTNAVLTNNGVKTGLLTTKGFRDALQMRRGMREVLYDNKYTAPEPLVPRYLRLPVEERVTLDGNILTPVNREDVVKGAQQFRDEKVQSVAVCLLHSYANTNNEKEVGEILRELLPDTYLTLSCELLPQIRFYDRVSTTVLNSYVGPILERYLTNLTK